MNSSSSQQYQELDGMGISPDSIRSRDDSARGLSSRVGFLLAQLGTHRHRRFAERLAPLDLHPRHFGMLSQLAANEGQSQQALSRALGLHRSAMVALVDERHHSAAMESECPAEGLLGLTLVGSKLAEHPEVPWVEVERRETLGEASVSMSAELRQEESYAAAQSPRRVVPRANRVWRDAHAVELLILLRTRTVH